MKDEYTDNPDGIVTCGNCENCPNMHHCVGDDDEAWDDDPLHLF